MASIVLPYLSFSIIFYWARTYTYVYYVRAHFRGFEFRFIFGTVKQVYRTYIKVELFFILYLRNLVFLYDDIVTYVLMKKIYMIVDYFVAIFTVFFIGCG